MQEYSVLLIARETWNEMLSTYLRLLMEAGNQVLENCGERKTFTLVLEMWINIVNIENGMEAHQRMKTGPAS